MVFTTEGLAIESWPELDLNPRPLNPVQTLFEDSDSEHSDMTNLSIYSSSKAKEIYMIHRIKRKAHPI